MAADAVFHRDGMLVQQSVTRVRRRRGTALAAWVGTAQASGIPPLAPFAPSLRQDWAAMQAVIHPLDIDGLSFHKI